LTADNCVSIDKSSELLADIDSLTKDASHVEYVKVDLSMVSKEVSCMLLFLDGGPRNFKHVQNVRVHVEELVVDRDLSFASTGRAEPRISLLEMVQRTRRDSQGVATCVLYRRFYPDGSVTWELKSIFDPLFVSTMRDKDEKVGHIIVNHVPSLEKFRPRLFQSVKAICSALSSKALPLLKDKFAGSGLPIDCFVETIFKQLYEQSPRLSDPSEAEYLVAMLYDMFSQIDLNGDGSVDWDEFTSFTINIGIDASDRSMAELEGAEAGGTTSKSDTTGANQHKNTLDEYIIEYAESSSYQTPYTFQDLASVRHFPEADRIIVVPDGSDKAIFFDGKGREVNRFFPAKAEATVITEMADMEKRAIPHGNSEKALIVYDCIYLSGRELYAYTASDHSIGICKEKNYIGGTKKGAFDMYNKIIFSNSVHVKLCWSQKSNILCTIAANNDIHGWNIDTGTQLFNISRHSDVITDILALDEKELFATCSLDKRVVLWSMSSRRVKGVLIGHKRGIRCMSVARNTLLTAGFECDAKTWNLSLKEIALTLKGHRFPITTARIMALESGNDEDLRAITVDESHELRLWSVHLKERASEAALAPVLQIFTPRAAISKNDPFKYIIFPYNEHASKGYYSDFFAFGKNIHYFTAEKETQDYVPPTCFAFNEAAGSLSTSIRQNLLKYDIASGQFSSIFYNVNKADITAMCFDDERGRKLYIGCGNGDLMIVNYTTGAVMTTFPAHSKEITRLFSIPANDAVMQSYNLIASGGLDGKFKITEESGGELTVVFMHENPFSDGSSVGQIKGILSSRILGVASNSFHWSIWSIAHYKRLILVREEHPILDFEFIPKPSFEENTNTQDSYDFSDDPRMTPSTPSHSKVQTANDDIIVAAVAMAHGVNIYAVDFSDYKVIFSHRLVHPDAIYISNLVFLRCNEEHSVNYLSSRNTGEMLRLGQFLVAGTDDGRVVAWGVDDIFTSSINKYRYMYPLGGTSSKASFQSMSVGRKASMKKLEDEEDEERLVGIGKGRRKKVAKSRIDVSIARELAPDLETRSSGVMWKAHQDFIAGIWPLHIEGCIITLSHDGYQRVWNMDKECLGELMLTNLTDEMKAKSLTLGLQHAWKFVQERIPISDMHKQIARDFLRMMQSSPDAKKRSKSREKSGNVSGNSSPLAIDTLSPSFEGGGGMSPMRSQAISAANSADDSEELSRLILRNYKLHEARHPGIDETGRIEFDESAVVSPVRVASPARTASRNSRNLDDSWSQMSSGDSGDDKDELKASEVLDQQGSSPKSPPRALSRQRGKKGKCFWIKASETGFANAAAPFSEASISLSKQFGVIDTETQQLLRTIGRNKNTVRAYDRIVPPLYLRSSSIENGIEVPKLDNIETAEILFGTQRVILSCTSQVENLVIVLTIRVGHLQECIGAL
jgi:WD40 repeat protein